MAKKKNLLLVSTVLWTVLYFVFLKIVLSSSAVLANSTVYIVGILSYSLISLAIPYLLKDAKTDQVRLYSFLIPFVFGVLLVVFFVIAMANVESFYAANVLGKTIKSLKLLPYAIGKGLLLGLPMGLLGYLFGGVSSLITKKFAKKW